ncbi:MAG TPA: hypothetical protein VI318_14290 [Baekduia sp.]
MEAGANIIRSDQYSTDPSGGVFFLRMEFTLAPERREGFAERFGLVADRFDMSWRLWDAGQRKRIAVLVSRYDHCLMDHLYRWERDELDGDLVMVASNHPDAREAVEAAGLTYLPGASVWLRAGCPEIWCGRSESGLSRCGFELGMRWQWGARGASRRGRAPGPFILEGGTP